MLQFIASGVFIFMIYMLGIMSFFDYSQRVKAIMVKVFLWSGTLALGFTFLYMHFFIQ